jgi:hypothetical protein
MILFGPMTIGGCSYFVINLVTKAESSSLFSLEQVEVGIISLTDVKTQNCDMFPFYSSTAA